MAYTFHWVVTLSLSLATISCQNARNFAEESESSYYLNKSESFQQEDSSSLVVKRFKIHPSKSWLFRRALGSTKAVTKMAYIETIGFGTERSQGKNHGIKMLNFAEGKRYGSLRMKDGSNKDEFGIQIRLIEKILWPKYGPMRWRRSRRNALTGSSPVVNAALNKLNASYCSLFYYRIPDNIFVDKEDGSTRNLSLSLHFENDTLVGPTSWLQLDGNLQTLYGYLKVSDDILSNSNKLFNYKLRATDSSGLTADTLLSITVPSNPPEVYFRMDLVVNPHEDLGTPDVNEVLFLAYRVFNFFQDLSFSTMNVLSFQKNHSTNHTADSIAFGWTNCTVSGRDCPIELVNSLINKIIMPDGSPNPSFSNSLQPQYKISDLKARKVGTCRGIATSLQPSATPVQPSATPVASLSPIIISAIPQLSVLTTVYFRYQIPTNTFLDSVDGNTRSLSLELRTVDSIALTTSSWLQFDTKTQTLYGILTSNLFSVSSTVYFNYALIATNSRGFNTIMVLKLKGSRQIVSFGALFLLQGRDNSLSFTNDVTILSTMLQSLRGYLKDTQAGTIEVASFTRTVTGQQRIFSLAYSNTTITTSNCDALDKLIPILKGKDTLIHGDLTVALAPDVVADRVDVTRYGNCSLGTNQTVSPTPVPGGQYPTVQNKVPAIDIKTGVIFRYHIPTNTFYDSTDGNTAKLALKVFELSGSNLSRDSWIQFDASNQILYGLLPSNLQTVRPLQNFTYLLQARNSLGNTGTQTVTIQSEFISLDIGVVVTFIGRDYSSSQLNRVQLQSFILTQLKEYLAVESNGTIRMLSFEQQASGGSQFFALWTDTRLASSGCDLTLLLNLESKVFSSKDRIHKDLISRLLPNVVVPDGNITYYGKCSQNQSTNAPIYYTALPIITAQTGFLFTYTIPQNTFKDNVDGDTRSLRLTLSNSDGSVLSSTSRIQFNSSKQVITGIFLHEDLQGTPTRNFYYALTATNSGNVTTTIPLSIAVTLNSNTYGVIVNTSTSIILSEHLDTVKLAFDFLQKLSEYIMPSISTDFSIVSLHNIPTSTHQQANIIWSYVKINGMDCNRTKLDHFKALLNQNNGDLNPLFTTSMSPDFSLLASSTQTLNNCNGASSSTTTAAAVPVSITPTKSMPSISPGTPSVIVIKNNPPSVTSKILPLFAYFCVPFSYTIPSDLFFDQEQGGTRNLQVHLENHDRQSVGTTSWLQLSKSSQVIYGILKIDDFYRKPIGGYKYYLVATDNEGLQVASDFKITIPESPIKYNHIINITLNRVFDDSVPDVNEQLLISTRILESFSDKNLNNINLISYKNSPKDKKAVFTYGNCSLTYSPCPTIELAGILSKITDSDGRVTDSFRNSMLSQYTIYSIKTEKLPPCNSSQTPSIPITSSVILPTPSVPPLSRPIVQEPIGQLNITWCEPFVYQIPPGMFHDIKDGSTRNLSLELVHLNGSALAKDYWMKFDSVSQKLSAYPTINDLDQYVVKKFIVRARNSKNLTTSYAISVTSTKSKPNPNHQLLITASAYVTEDLYDIDIRILIYNKMKAYFKLSQSEVISFANYAKTGQSPANLQFTFSYCSLSENACDRSELDPILKKIFSSPDMINSDFILAFRTEIVVQGVVVSNLGACSSTVPTPSLSTSEVMSSSIAINVRNQRPLVLQNIGTVDVDPCRLFTFNVPERSFYDIEDGLTPSLKLTVATLNGSPLSNTSWIMFNATTQSFKGVIVTAKDTVEELRFVLTATDKGGLSASQTLQFRVKTSSNPPVFIVSTTATNHFPTGISKVEILEYFLIRLVSYLSTEKQVSMQILSLEQTIGNKINISWAICNFAEACNATLLSTIRDKIILQDGTKNPSLVAALGPSLSVDRLRVQSSQNCASSTIVTLNTPSYTGGLTSPLIVSTTRTYSSTIVPNNPPRFNKDLRMFNVSMCSPFSFELPSNLCVDPEDGFSGVAISVKYRNGTSLSGKSLLQFNNENKSIRGVVKASDLTPVGQLKSQFLVYCEDTQSLRVSRNLNINVTTTFTIGGNRNYSLTFQAYFSSQSKLPDIDIQTKWTQKLRDYLQDTSGSKIMFLNFKHDFPTPAEFSIRFCSLDPCNQTAVGILRNKIFATFPNLNPLFIDAMVPEFKVVSASIQVPLEIVCPTTSSAQPLSILLQSSSIYQKYNTPIAILRDIPAINITICNLFQYEIPTDTFYDKEDGYTLNLTVVLTYENNTAVDSSSWVQYDNEKLRISGYILHEVAALSNVFIYKLVARDSRGSIASIPITLRLLSKHQSVNHYFETEGELKVSHENDVAIMKEFSDKMKTYVGGKFDKGVFFVHFAKYNGQPPKVVFTWGSCALLESCDQTSLKTISDRLFVSGTVLNSQFIAALTPSINVTKVTQSSIKDCTEARTSTVTSPASMVTSTLPSLLSIIIVSPTSYFPDFSTEAISPTTAYTMAISSTVSAHPVVRNPLNPVIATICSIFFFQIPENTFYDPSDGYTRHLKITAQPQSINSIYEDNWLKFDSDFQTFTGHPTIDAAKRQPKIGYLFSIRAMNKMNLSVETSLIVKIDENYPNANHDITLHLEELGTPFLNTIDALSFIKNKTGVFFGDTFANNIGIITYSGNMTLSKVTNVTWYNCSTAASTCDVFTLGRYFSKMVDKNGNANVEFSSVFLPRFRLIHVTTSISHNCYGPLSTPLPVSITNTRLTVTPSLQSIASQFVSPVKQSISKYLLSSVIKISNNPPVAKASINISLPLCMSLRLAIPTDVFHDNEDGGIDNLDVRLLSMTGNETSCNSTIRLNQTTKEIYGGAVLSEMRAPMSLLLTAKDKEGLAATTTVSLSIQAQPQFTTFVATIKIKQLKSKCRAENIEDIYNVFKLHLPLMNIAILQYETDDSDFLHTITLTDCSLLDAKCDSNRTSFITQNMIRNDTIDMKFSSLVSQIGELQSVSVFSTELCRSEPNIYMNVTYCSKIKYNLNGSHFNSTVFDIQRQRKELLSYRLATTNGAELPWVRFDSKTNSITVTPVYNALKNRSTTYFILTATYAGKAVKSMRLMLFHHQLTEIQVNYTISMKIISYKQVSLSDMTLIEEIMERLSKFANGWLIVDYNRTGIFPETVYATLAPCFAISQCNDTLKNSLTSWLALDNGVPSYSVVRAFFPDLVLSELSVTSKGTCDRNFAEKPKSRINITVALCTQLYSPVKDNMIAMYVNITEADYQLLNSKKEEVGLESWVQFNKKNRVIYGAPTQQDMIKQTINGTLFFLRVWDKSKTQTDIPININIIGSTEKPTYAQAVVYQSLPQRTQAKADILLEFQSKIAGLLGNTSSEGIGLISFHRGADLSRLMKIEFTNCTFLQSPRFCDNYRANVIKEKTIKGNGRPSDAIITALGMNYTIIKIIETRSYACGNSSNSPPRISVSLPQLNVSLCARFDFVIPNDTFVDAEDGSVASLLLSLKYVNGSALKAASWVQFDVKTRTIYGISTYDIIEKKPVNGYTYLLEARDSQNGLVSLPVTVNLNENITDRSLVNVVMAISLPEWVTTMEVQRLFLQKTERCLNVSEQSIAIAYYRKADTPKEFINVSIFHNCSKASNFCDEESITKFLGLFVSNATVKKAYKACMANQFSVIEATVSLSKQCRNLTVNNPPIVNRLIPQLNFTVCKALYYKIPTDTFTDTEDGKSILDNIELTAKYGEPVMRSDFVQYNKTDRMIYALLPQRFISNASLLVYNLQVKDTAGQLASTRVLIKPVQTLNNFTYKVCLSLRKYSTTVQSDIDTIINLLDRIGHFISNVKETGRLVVLNYSIGSAYPQGIEFCFSNCSYANGSCDGGSVNAIRKKLFIRDAVPTLEFRTILNPDFVIMKVADEYSRQCTVNVTPTTALPLTTAYLTSSATVTPVSNCLSGQNSVPFVLNSIGTLTAYIGQPRFYTIKKDVIYDKEDGYLSISTLTDIDGKETQESWIQYDKKNQRIYISAIKSDLRGEKRFKVVGRDSCGTSVYDVIKIKILGSVSCCYTIRLLLQMNYSTFDGDARLQYSMYNRLTEIYNDTVKNLRFYSINRGSRNQTEVSYTNSSFSNESCYYTETRQLAHVGFYENGTARKEFIMRLSGYQVYDAVVNNDSECNGTIAIVPPAYVPTPVNSKVRTYPDWLWYMLPFIILAFFVVCCCLLFYWCKACHETFCGPKKADDLFTAAAAQPIKEEVMPQQGAATQFEDPRDFSAAVATAARPTDGATDPYIDAIYADITTTKDSTVPSLHKQKQAPWWKRRPDMESSPLDEAFSVVPVAAGEEPMIEAVAAMPQEAPTSDVGPQLNIASQPRRGTSEEPLTASQAPNVQRRPSYVITPSTSAISLQEDPLTQSVAPITKAGQPVPERELIDEELISPVSRHNLEAEVSFPFDMAPDFSPLLAEDDMPIEASEQPDASPELRLPSIPPLPPEEPPPSYSSLELHKKIPTRRRSIAIDDPLSHRVLPSNDSPRMRPSRRRRGGVLAFEEHEMIPIVKHRRTTPSQPKDQPLFYTIPKQKTAKFNLIRRALSRSRGQGTDPLSSLYTKQEPVISRKRTKSVPRYTGPSVISLRRSPSLVSYVTENDTSETSLEDYSQPEMRRSERKEFWDLPDDSSQSQSEKQVPVKINGVVDAPESVLMKWMRDGKLRTTITNMSPELEQRKKPRDDMKYRIRSPNSGRRREKKKHKSASVPVYEVKEKLARSPSKRKVHKKPTLVYSPSLYVDDSISDDVFLNGRASERMSVRGYAHSKDPYEYVQSAPKRRKSGRISEEWSTRKASTKRLDLEKGRISSEKKPFRIFGKSKSRRNINEVLERMSRRKRLRREREEFENKELYSI